jgi:tRNA(fMet)-specific endonuclease VapC
MFPYEFLPAQPVWTTCARSPTRASFAFLPSARWAMCVAELFYGAQRSRDPARSLAVQQRFLQPYRSLPFDDAAAEIAGSLRAQLAARGMPIGPYDLQIAAIALANQCTLVTHNLGEFGRIPNLSIEDWEAT